MIVDEPLTLSSQRHNEFPNGLQLCHGKQFSLQEGLYLQMHPAQVPLWSGTCWAQARTEQMSNYATGNGQAVKSQ